MTTILIDDYMKDAQVCFTNHKIEFKNVHLRSGFEMIMLLAKESIENDAEV